VRIFARSVVERIDEGPNGLSMRVAGGLTVSAAHVVVAAGYDSLPFLRAKNPSADVADIDNTFALVTQPLADPRRAAALPHIWESARPYIYLRGTTDGRIMLGGADLPFKDATARDALLPRQVRKLANYYQELFGEELPAMQFAWAGSFATTPDGLPFIGRVPGVDPRLQFALCFGGNGITYAAHAGDMIRAGIEGRAHPLESVFGFGRLGTELTEAGGRRVSQ
jgi:glycine/D-amino acid oxidase-like deaminating enzyme